MIAALEEFCAGVEARMKAEDAAASVTVEVLSMTPGLDTAADSPVVAFGRGLGLPTSPAKVTYGTEAGVYAAVIGELRRGKLGIDVV